jgi:uncharacterized membrane protein
MDWAHLHLVANHFPVIGSIFGLITVVWGILRGTDDVKKVGLVALVFTALIAVPVYLTGEPAEEVVENLPGVAEQFIDAHERFALYALVASIVSGAVALGALFVTSPSAKKSIQRGLLGAVLLLSAITVGMMAWTANLGGQIRHTEIRSGGSQTGTAEPAKASDDDDR